MDNVFTFTLEELYANIQNEEDALSEKCIHLVFEEEILDELYEPDQLLIDRILSYSKALSVQESEMIGFVEYLKN